jgi:ATP-dependent DNA ligase
MPWPVPLDLKPMLAKLTREIPSGSGFLFEPKWDGFRCIVFRDGDEIVLQSRNQRPFNRYFPELLPVLAEALPEHCVVDGEVVVPAADGPDGAGQGLDFDALQQRIHPAESRVRRLAGETPSSFVAFDLLALGEESLLDVPFGTRRERLAEVLTPVTGTSGVYLTPATTDAAVAERWFTRFEGAGLDGVMAKPLDGIYAPDKRTLVKVKHERTADCAVAGYRIHKDGQGVGSLLLGLYGPAWEPGESGEPSETEGLHPVGVCSGFSVKFRGELLAEMEPLTHDALDGHPWAEWAGLLNTGGAPPGGGSRWQVGKDMSFVPVRVERVVEVTFGQLEGRRFRHGVQFVRWRPDRTPESCRYDQLEVAEPVGFHEVLADRA